MSEAMVLCVGSAVMWVWYHNVMTKRELNQKAKAKSIYKSKTHSCSWALGGGEIPRAVANRSG